MYTIIEQNAFQKALEICKIVKTKEAVATITVAFDLKKHKAAAIVRKAQKELTEQAISENRIGIAMRDYARGHFDYVRERL